MQKNKLYNGIAFEGSFSVPHFLLGCEFSLSKSEILLLLALFKLYGDFIRREDAIWSVNWFNVHLSVISSLIRMRKNTIKRARMTLAEKGLIRFKKGYGGRNSEYLVDVYKFHLPGSLLG